MGLNSLLNVLTPAALAAVLPSVQAAMKATVTVFDPKISTTTYNSTTGATTSSPEAVVYTGPARIIDIANASITQGDSVQRVNIQTVKSLYTGTPHKGMIVKVTVSPSNASLLTYVYTVISAADSSNPITRNLECSVNYAYVSN